MEFDIPSVEPQAFHAKADIVWSDSFEMGLRFLYIEKDSGVALKSWLSLLESQCQLRESAVHTREVEVPAEPKLRYVAVLDPAWRWRLATASTGRASR